MIESANEWLILGAAGLVLGYLLGSITDTVRKGGISAVWIFTATVLFIGAALLPNPALRIGQSSVDYEMRKLAVAEPLIGVLQATRQSDYQRVRAAILNHRNGTITRQVRVQQIRSVFDALYAERLPLASDEVVAQHGARLAEQLGELRSRPQLCAFWAQRLYPDLTINVRADLDAHSRDILLRIILDNPQGDARVASYDDVSSLIDEVAPTIAEEDDVTVSVAKRAVTGQGNARLACNATRRLLEKISELPPEQAAPLIRRIVGDRH